MYWTKSVQWNKYLNLKKILGDLPFCFIYVDDILIISPDEVTNAQNLRRVFELLRLHGLHISLPKSSS